MPTMTRFAGLPAVRDALMGIEQPATRRALAMNVDVERSRRAGCGAVSVKPLRYTELYAVTGRLLQEAQPPATRATPADRAAP